MLHRGLDATYPEEVRRRITLLTFARTAANGCFRFAPPFLATIASGLGVSLDTIGIAVAISELSGLVSPITGHLAERLHRRTAMAVGLAGVGAGAGLAAASHHVVMFAAALIVIAQSKVMFDLGLGAWISDRVAYERRGRALGLTETSWAMGLLLGVSAMGLVTAASSWRAAYLAGAIAVLAMAAAVSRTVAGDPAEGHEHARAPRPAGGLRVPTAGWMLVVAALCLMSSSQMLFVTFGSWLKDHHGFHDAGVAALAFGLGAGELFASLSAARFSDRWGRNGPAPPGRC
ncbi:MAG: MFS transporter [Ilumatobacteraceae bacterium]